MKKSWLVALSLLFSATTVATTVAAREGGTSGFRPEEVVVKIKRTRPRIKESIKRVGLVMGSDYGTGWCLDQECEFVVGNYHVAERTGTPLKIKGVNVLRTYSATGPQDEGAVWVKSPLGYPTKLVPVRDITISRMAYPLKGMHGITFSPRELREGENVAIYGHPRGGKLTKISATFYMEGGDGVLFFKVKPGEEKALVPGISGGLPVNEENEAVGLVQSISDNLVGVVPVWSLFDFTRKVLPDKYREIFPFSADEVYRPGKLVPVDLRAQAGALAKDIDPAADGKSPASVLPEEYLWYNLDKPTPPLTFKTADTALRRRTEEPPEIQMLRRNAQEMAEKINDFTAIEKQRSGGGKSPEVTKVYKVRMVFGQQTFTDLATGKEVPQLPCPKGNGVAVGGEWSELPTMVGRNLKLKIQQVDDRNLAGWGKVKVFRYEAPMEDEVARLIFCVDYILFHTETNIAVATRGEVWTNENLEILRITQELLVPQSTHWQRLRSSILYGWLESPTGERRLVPTNTLLEGEHTDDRQTYWTIGTFSDYHQFIVTVVVGSGSK